MGLYCTLVRSVALCLWNYWQHEQTLAPCRISTVWLWRGDSQLRQDVNLDREWSQLRPLVITSVVQ